MSTTSGMPHGDDAPAVLHRRARRLEDAVWLLLTALVLVAAAVLTAVAVSVHGSTVERGRELAAERRLTSALVVTDAPIIAHGSYSTHEAEVRWTGRDGLPHTGNTTLTERHAPGETVEIWVDTRERPVLAPPDARDAVIAAAVTWLLGMMAAVAGIAVLGRLLLAWAWWRLGRSWEQDWAQVEPRWAGRSER